MEYSIEFYNGTTYGALRDGFIVGNIDPYLKKEKMLHREWTISDIVIIYRYLTLRKKVASTPIRRLGSISSKKILL